MKSLLNKEIKKYKNLSLQVKASFWFLICGFLQKGISTLTTPIFTRLLSTDEYGQYNLYFSWFNILTVLVTLNMSYGVYTQGLVKYEKERDSFTSSLQGLTSAIVSITFLIYICGHNFWNKVFQLSTPSMVCMFLSMWSTAAFGFWSARQRVDYKYKKLIILTLFIAIAKPLSGIIAILTFTSHKVEARIISLTVVELVAYTGLYVTGMAKGKSIYDRYHWKHALKFNIPLIPHYLSQTILSSSDRIMINTYCSKSDSGIYSLAYSLSMLMTIVNTAVTNTLGPWIYQNIRKKNYDKIGKISYSILLLIGVANLLLIALAPEAVAIFAPKSYFDAIWTIPPVTMSVFFMFMYSLFANFSFYFEKTKVIMVGSVAGAVINLVLNAIFIPKFGYIAAAYTTLICYILYAIGHYFFMCLTCNQCMNGYKVYNPMIIIAISIGFVLFGFVFMSLYNHPLIRYAFILSCMIAVFIKKDTLIILCKCMIIKNDEV